jgi:hypothetical protein
VREIYITHKSQERSETILGVSAKLVLTGNQYKLDSGLQVTQNLLRSSPIFQCHSPRMAVQHWDVLGTAEACD